MVNPLENVPRENLYGESEVQVVLDHWYHGKFQGILLHVGQISSEKIAINAILGGLCSVQYLQPSAAKVCNITWPLQCVAVCCSVLQCVAVCCSVLQCVAVCCSVLQCVAVCCSVGRKSVRYHVAVTRAAVPRII